MSYTFFIYPCKICVYYNDIFQRKSYLIKANIYIIFSPKKCDFFARFGTIMQFKKREK